MSQIKLVFSTLKQFLVMTWATSRQKMLLYSIIFIIPPLLLPFQALIKTFKVFPPFCTQVHILLWDFHSSHTPLSARGAIHTRFSFFFGHLRNNIPFASFGSGPWKVVECCQNLLLLVCCLNNISPVEREWQGQKVQNAPGEKCKCGNEANGILIFCSVTLVFQLWGILMSRSLSPPFFVWDPTARRRQRH